MGSEMCIRDSSSYVKFLEGILKKETMKSQKATRMIEIMECTKGKEGLMYCSDSIINMNTPAPIIEIVLYPSLCMVIVKG